MPSLFTLIAAKPGRSAAAFAQTVFDTERNVAFGESLLT